MFILCSKKQLHFYLVITKAGTILVTNPISLPLVTEAIFKLLRHTPG